MERRSSNTWMIAALAIACGFLVAVLLFRGGSDNASSTVGTTTLAGTNTATTATTATTTTGTTTNGTTTTTTTTQGAVPQDPQRTVGGCINLWNGRLNRGDQTFLINVMSQQPIRVHVGVTSDVPPKCEVTVIANNGNAYVFPEAGGQTYPYAQGAPATPASQLPAGQKISNALEQSDGTLAAR